MGFTWPKKSLCCTRRTRLSQTQQTLHAIGILVPAGTETQRRVLEATEHHLGIEERQALKATLQGLNSRSDSFHSDLRTLRNILFSITTLLLVGLAAMAVAAALAPGAFSLCGVPASSTCHAATVLDVEIAGGFGGLLSACLSLQPAERKYSIHDLALPGSPEGANGGGTRRYPRLPCTNRTTWLPKGQYRVRSSVRFRLRFCAASRHPNC
ncbi:MAG: hypothetical protein QOH92_177 [Chloroflexota bacterium]|nr:hypothetical protein [Chloroflexota bacterium]